MSDFFSGDLLRETHASTSATKRGAKTVATSETLRLAKEERERRAEDRAKNKAAVRFQKQWRGYVSRKRNRNDALSSFLRKTADVEKVATVLATLGKPFVVQAPILAQCEREFLSGTIKAVVAPERMKTEEQQTTRLAFERMLQLLTNSLGEDGSELWARRSSLTLQRLLMMDSVYSSGSSTEKLQRIQALIQRASNERAKNELLAGVSGAIVLCVDAESSNPLPQRLESLVSFLRASVDALHVLCVMGSPGNNSSAALNELLRGIGSVKSELTAERLGAALSRRRELLPLITSPSTLQAHRFPWFALLTMWIAVVSDEKRATEAELAGFVSWGLASLRLISSIDESGTYATQAQVTALASLAADATRVSSWTQARVLAFISRSSRLRFHGRSSSSRLTSDQIARLGVSSFATLDTAWSRVFLTHPGGGGGKGEVSSNPEDASILKDAMGIVCGATSLVAEALSEEELFDRQVLGDVTRIARHLRDLLYQRMWIDQRITPGSSSLRHRSSATTDEEDLSLTQLIELFTVLHGRCMRRAATTNEAKWSDESIWLFPNLPLQELGFTPGSSRGGGGGFLGQAEAAATFVEYGGNRTTSRTTRQQQVEEEESEDVGMDELNEDEDVLVPASASERGKRVLSMLPSVVPFATRVSLLRLLVARRRQALPLSESDSPFEFDELTQEYRTRSRFTDIRRDHVFEDAFRGLADRDLRSTVRVKFINAQGLPEAGIDGGGLFKEFLTSSCRAGLESSELFETLESGARIPRLGANLERLRFLGKLLGRAVFEGVLIEHELARLVFTFISGTPGVVHDLASLDATMYRSLIRLKTLDDATLQSLELTFSHTYVSPKTHRFVSYDLAPNGHALPVTRSNLDVYINRVADFKLNRERSAEISALARGFHEMIPSADIRMFSADEISLLVGGTPRDFNVSELAATVVYTGFTRQSPYIATFWEIVANELTAEQRGLLLRFVTSCSRPPLDGFESLSPRFTIQMINDGQVDRLPSSATCVNMLRLPVYPTRRMLRDKLILAIESQSGFELS